MRHLGTNLVMAVIAVAVSSLPAEAARRARRAVSPAAATAAYAVWLGEPASSRRSPVYRQHRTPEASYYSYGNVNANAPDLEIPRGSSARRAGTYGLRDNARSVFASARRVDGIALVDRWQEATSW